MIHTFQTQVYYEDTDMGGIVYHANYLKFIERARSAWVRSLGLDQNAMREAGTVFAVRAMTCDFRSPARFEDQLTISTQPKDHSGARILLDQTVTLADRVLFQADVTLVCLTTQGRPTRIPQMLRDALGRVCI